MIDAAPHSNHRLPGLDGLRAISIFLVLMVHCVSLPGFPHWWLTDAVWVRGGIGVQFFFAISGFLITWLLLREEQRGGINLGHFYARRAVRILPAATAFLAFVGLLAAMGISNAHRIDFVSCGLFLRNLIRSGSADTAHFWSLSVEEQFYLLWPFILVYAPKRFRLWFVALVIAVAPLWRQVNYWHYQARFVNPARLDITCDVLLCGCMLAILKADAKASKFLRLPVLCSSLAPISAVIVIGALLSPAGSNHMLRAASPTIINICEIAIINYAVESRVGVISSVLNWSAIRWVGGISYSLYLWQQLFCWKDASLVLPFPGSIIATVIAAVISYYVIEQSALRFRQKLRSPRQRGFGVTICDEQPVAA